MLPQVTMYNEKIVGKLCMVWQLEYWSSGSARRITWGALELGRTQKWFLPKEFKRQTISSCSHKRIEHQIEAQTAATVLKWAILSPLRICFHPGNWKYLTTQNYRSSYIKQQPNNKLGFPFGHQLWALRRNMLQKFHHANLTANSFSTFPNLMPLIKTVNNCQNRQQDKKHR